MKTPQHVAAFVALVLALSCRSGDGAPEPLTGYDSLVYQWLVNEQLSNGLLESSSGSNFVSLYDNSLAALAYIAKQDYGRAEATFDFFRDRITSELRSGTGGFFQFRDRHGKPLQGSGRWLGDNAWLLIALNNYKAKANSAKYDELALAIEDWIRSLRDTDGSLWGGYDPVLGTRVNKVTENMIDAFNAVPGYDDLHKNLLGFFAAQRWDPLNQVLVAAPGDYYQYALDNMSWGYCALEDFPVSSLSFAERTFSTTHRAATGVDVSGFCIDVDRDHVFLEGTGQMVVALQKAGWNDEADKYLREIEKAVIRTTSATAGIPYATNLGTGYGPGLLWQGADTLPCVSSAAWYVFGMARFDPMAAGYSKNIPAEDKFWLK